jgi:methyl-accepting chemotaxis protein
VWPDAAISYGTDGYLWINDLQPKMIMHPKQPKLDGTDLSGYKDPDGTSLFLEFVKVCKEKGEGLVKYKWPKPGATQPVAKISYVKIYEPWGWIMGTGTYLDGVAAEVSGLRWRIIAVFVLLGFIIAVMAFQVARRITGPLEKMSKAVKRMADGDLAVVFEGEDTTDEVGMLTQDLKKMALSLKGVIKGIWTSTNQVLSAVEVVKSAMDRARTGTQDQAQQASQVATAAEEMTQTIMDIARNAQTASVTSADAMRIAEEGKTIADGAVRKVNTVYAATTELGTMVERLNNKVNEIDNIVTVINDIADQTNLLALNAAIEAARAGDQGRGFAVVADEVKKLAERTIQATAEISTKVKAVQDESQQTTLSMEGAALMVSEATDYINQLGTVLGNILGGVQKTSDGIAQMVVAVEQQSDSSDEIARSIAKTSLIAREIETGSAEVLGQVAGLGEVAKHLGTSVSEFKTD